MPFTDYEPCVPYCTPADVLLCCKVATDAGLLPTDPRIADAIEDASQVLYFATGRQFSGTCDATFRPCLACGCDDGGCCCGRNVIDVGNLWPVISIVSVLIDGVAHPGSEFHVDNWHELVRNGGLQWPKCNNLSADSDPVVQDALSAVATNLERPFEITITHGMPVPNLLKRAARDLACHLLQVSCLGDVCLLPERVTAISRRGISMDVGDTFDDAFRNGLIGIYSVDLAISTFNPSRLQSPSFIWDPSSKVNRIYRTFTS